MLSKNIIDVHKGNLNEVSFIRPILIVLLVLYHAMCIHTGNWEPIDGMTVIPAYRVIGKLAYTFMLEAFVFISGYVWAYQHKIKKQKENLLQLMYKKSLRLIVPTILFGLLYIVFIEKSNINVPHLLEGPGHLWFLPMLFWCFLIGWCILRLKLSSKIVLPVLFIISLLRPAHLPLRLSYTLYYLFFFFSGYYIQEYSNKIKEMIRGWHVIVSWLMFFVIYLLFISVSNRLSISYRGGYSMIGTIALYLTAIYVTHQNNLKRWYIQLGSLCMGVYVFQQFILKMLYYQTYLPQITPEWVLPPIGFSIALLVSLILTYIIRLSKFGKKLL